jgi:hypothetical protein
VEGRQPEQQEDTMATIGALAGAIGKGLVAGAVGTAAITASQLIVMKLRGGEPSDAPVQAAEKVLGVEPATEEEQEKVNNLIHWAYGTGLGAVRGVLSTFGLGPVAATTAHFGVVWGGAATMLPALQVAPPPTEWPAEEIVVDAWHHAVYALAAGVAYELLDRSDRSGG